MKRWNRVATDWKHILEVNNAAGSSLSFSGIFPHDGGFFRRLVEETFRSIKYFIAGEQFHSDLRSPLNIFPIITVFREKSAEEIPGPVANIIKYYYILKPTTMAPVIAIARLSNRHNHNHNTYLFY